MTVIDIVVHEASRTGAPRVLLELLRYTTDHSDHEFAIRSLVSGPLDAEFQSVATSDTPSSDAPMVVNGIGALGALAEESEVRPILLYTHEVGLPFERLEPTETEILMRESTTVLCVSETAEQQLQDLGVDRDRLHVLPPAVTDRGSPSPEAIESARSAFGDPDRPLVVGCGEAVWRKAPDLFLETARHVRLTTDADFLWVGRLTAATARKLFHDRDSLGLTDRVEFLGEVADALPYLAAADILVVCSRNDPQPLVMIEAALVGTPTVGWDLEGMADLAAAGGAMVVPYPDVSALGDSIAGLLADQSERDRLAANGRQRFESRQRLEVVGDQFIAHLDNLLDAAEPN